MKENLAYLLADFTPSPLQGLDFAILVCKFDLNIVGEQ